jgi:hypothetical protein
MKLSQISAVLLMATSVSVAVAQTPPKDQAPVEGPPGVTYSGGDGASCDAAVKIHARDTGRGIAAEKAWVSARYPNFKLRGQSLRSKSGLSFDVIEITTATGENKSICFDITEFFGKW